MKRSAVVLGKRGYGSDPTTSRSLFASYLTPKAAVGRSRIAGKGIVATDHIATGGLVAVWGGHLITWDEMQTLPDDIREHPVQIWHSLFVGPRTAEEIEPVDYMNHSCEPTCGVKGQIIVVARRDIAPGEELTFDYATTDTVGLDFQCHCDAPSCRGRVTSDDWKSPAFQAQNAGYLSTYIQEMIDQCRRGGPLCSPLRTHMEEAHPWPTA